MSFFPTGISPPPPPPPLIPIFAPPPLPPGWTEHKSAEGHTYYYNASVNQSTYTRPLPSFLPPPPPPPPPPHPLPATHTFSPALQIWPAQVQLAAGKKKKEKMIKRVIEGTEWIRVKRPSDGVVFYTHKGRKESVWEVPEEIKEIVENLEREGMFDDPVDVVDDEKEKERERDEKEREREEKEKEEREREREVERVKMEVINGGKRKATIEEDSSNKKAKMDDDDIPSPTAADLSLEEGKALFKTLLQEKDVNPLLPWDLALPLFVSDPRYTLLTSTNARRESFDEYCRERSRSIRASKAATAAAAKKTPKEGFEQLLREEVRSTRTIWEEWRRKWKKDRRYFSFGRDERERERKFREWVRELGERKRGEAKRAESGFFEMLREMKGVVRPDSVWKEVKDEMSRDERYEAVGSSSLREELFETYVKTLASLSEEDEKKARVERAVKDRAQKVRADRTKVNQEMAKSRDGLSREEGELQFKSLLVDAVREPLVTWESISASLSRDPRFIHSSLSASHQQQLFRHHLTSLRSKSLSSLHTLFQSHAPSLSTPFSSLPIQSILSSPPATKLKFRKEGDLEDEFERWQRERNVKAREEFEVMLGENSFVEFWGRVGKDGGSGTDGTTKIKGVVGDDEEEGEGEGGGGTVDLKALAKGIDIKEMERVLKNDKRYMMFEHVPEQRARWIKDYVTRLSAPKLSVHVPDQ